MLGDVVNADHVGKKVRLTEHVGRSLTFCPKTTELKKVTKATLKIIFMMNGSQYFAITILNAPEIRERSKKD
jgi:hypothetical protein